MVSKILNPKSEVYPFLIHQNIILTEKIETLNEAIFGPIFKIARLPKNLILNDT